MITLKKTIDIKPVSDSYRRYFELCKHNQINCLEGAFRAGKTVINCLAFANYLETCPDKLHLASGSSEGTARLNIAECNGLGIKYLFAGRCKSGKYEENSCLKIQTRTGEKIVIFVGGGKSDSYKRIQGNSYGSWIATELTNHYCDDTEKDFIAMAISRLTQSNDRKMFFDMNPTYPSHRVYAKYIDKFAKQQAEGSMLGGYNYLKCSLFDNNALSDLQKQHYASMFQSKNSMEYRRFVLGERAVAEGLIFREFSANPDPLVIKDINEIYKISNKNFISIGVDFGGNKSATAFVATLFYGNYEGIVVIASSKMNMKGGESDATDLKNAFIEFVQKVQKLNVANILYCFCDCAEKILTNELRSCKSSLGLSFKVLDSVKSTISERIKTKKVLMSKKCWRVFCDAETVINATKTVVWDSRAGHEDERLDDGSTDIDTSDAEEYSWSCFSNKLLLHK